jgi:hypothetical protein
VNSDTKLLISLIVASDRVKDSTRYGMSIYFCWFSWYLEVLVG